ncbi:endonuclease [Paenimyroides aestuarii]|uniref:Endonuclease n=1 Tax=Paenimyroides aestuarii TaxID=2968490 RepID=A0ABY5NPE7_9FLAO|nr:endonuclease [Paenimyroides aestuarii]UUV20416.1 endonuclease [Paenimyroides aestuarii]
MKKIISFIVTICCSFTIFAQAPANYYNSATGTGYALKSQLKTIISANHIDLTYGGLWDLYSDNAIKNGFRDKYYENDNTILDIYSEKPVAADPYNYTVIMDQCGNYNSEGDCYNREHLIPQSYFDQNSPMRTDAFHVWPTDGKVNGERGNLPFGKVGSASYTSQNGTKRGTSAVTGYSGTVVEPIDEFKGDIARAYFYFATRYEDFMDDFYTDHPNAEIRAMFDGSTNKVFSNNFLDMLYQWHLQDPVSMRETNLNDFIYSEQGNRNPYIDNPQYVTAVWFPNLLTNTQAELVEFNVYPNPAPKNTIYISTKEKIDTITIYSLEGKLIMKFSNPQFHDEVFTINHLKSGTYIIKLKAGKNITDKKVIVK